MGNVKLSDKAIELMARQHLVVKAHDAMGSLGSEPELVERARKALWDLYEAYTRLLGKELPADIGCFLMPKEAATLRDALLNGTAGRPVDDKEYGALRNDPKVHLVLNRRALGKDEPFWLAVERH